jgi:hypothetical protein
VRNTIHIGAKQGNGSQYTTRLHRWFDVERPHLLSVLSYSPFDPTKWAGRVPKLNTKAIITAFEDAYSRGKKLDQSLVSRTTKYILHFKKTAYNWLNFCRDLPPCYDQNYKPISHTQFDSLSVLTPEIRDAVFLTLNGKIQFSYWIATGDDFHVTRWMFGDLPIDLSLLDKADFEGLKTLADELDSAMKNAVSFKLNAGKRVGNYNLARCREVTDKSDQILSNAFGLAAVWDDIELLYTQFMRTDFNDSGEDSDE